MESLRLMMGGAIKEAGANSEVVVRRTASMILAAENTLNTKFTDDYDTEVTTAPAEYKYINLTTGKRGQVDSSTPLVAAVNDSIRIFWDEKRTGSGKGAVEIVISPNTFPGTLTNLRSAA